MAKERDDRYTTAQELAEDLRRFLDRKPIQARRLSPLDRASRWARRHRSAVATAVALLVIVGGGLVRRRRLDRASPRACGRGRGLGGGTGTRKSVRIVDAANPPPPADVPFQRLVGRCLGPRPRGRKPQARDPGSFQAQAAATLIDFDARSGQARWRPLHPRCPSIPRQAVVDGRIGREAEEPGTGRQGRIESSGTRDGRSDRVSAPTGPRCNWG